MTEMTSSEAEREGRLLILENARTNGQRLGAKLVERTPSKAARMIPELGARVDRETSPGMRALGQAEAILDNLHAATRCQICGRDLTDPVSVKRGIGPDCIAKLRREAELERAYREAMEAIGRPAIRLEPEVVYSLRRGADRATVSRPHGFEPYKLPLTIEDGSAYPKSPDGHAYGYGGSGPSQLALDVLTDYLEEKPAPSIYQAFKRRFIETASGPEWTVSSSQIDAFLVELAREAVDA